MGNPHSNLYPESKMQLCRPRVGSASRHRTRLALQPTCTGGFLKDVGVLRHPHPTHSHFPEPLEPPGSRTVSRGRWDERKAEWGPVRPVAGSADLAEESRAATRRGDLVCPVYMRLFLKEVLRCRSHTLSGASQGPRRKNGESAASGRAKLCDTGRLGGRAFLITQSCPPRRGGPAVHPGGGRSLTLPPPSPPPPSSPHPHFLSLPPFSGVEGLLGTRGPQEACTCPLG